MGREKPKTRQPRTLDKAATPGAVTFTSDQVAALLANNRLGGQTTGAFPPLPRTDPPGRVRARRAADPGRDRPAPPRQRTARTPLQRVPRQFQPPRHGPVGAVEGLAGRGRLRRPPAPLHRDPQSRGVVPRLDDPPHTEGHRTGAGRHHAAGPRGRQSPPRAALRGYQPLHGVPGAARPRAGRDRDGLVFEAARGTPRSRRHRDLPAPDPRQGPVRPGDPRRLHDQTATGPPRRPSDAPEPRLPAAVVGVPARRVRRGHGPDRRDHQRVPVRPPRVPATQRARPHPLRLQPGGAGPRGPRRVAEAPAVDPRRVHRGQGPCGTGQQQRHERLVPGADQGVRDLPQRRV